MRCIDANIWVYYFDPTTAEHEDVLPEMTDALKHGRVFTNTAIEMEVVHYFVKRITDSQRYIDRFIELDNVTSAKLTRSDVVNASELLESYSQTGIGGRDASLVMTMKRFGINCLWTHDTALKRLGDSLDWMTVVDPVETGS